MTPVHLFVAPRFSARSDIRLIDPDQETAKNGNPVLFKQLPHDFSFTTFDVVPDIEKADFVVIPQGVRKLDRDTRAYLANMATLAKTHGKQLLVFMTGDYCYRLHIDIPNTVVYKSSDFKHALRQNEIVPAPYVGDLAEEHPIQWRSKGARPVVSFCGYAGFPSLKNKIKYIGTNLLLSMKAFLVGKDIPKAYKRGIYFRLQALKHLRKDSRINPLFIIRTTFSGNVTTAEKDPATLRKEFLDNIVNSDFVLTPKGDGNFSARFYETLSLGRIPVLIDTDMVLPFSDLIDYDSFIVRVPYMDVHKAGDYIMRWWDARSDEEFQATQRSARNAFETYLRYDRYFNRALPLLRDKGIAAVLAGK